LANYLDYNHPPGSGDDIEGAGYAVPALHPDFGFFSVGPETLKGKLLLAV